MDKLTTSACICTLELMRTSRRTISSVTPYRRSTESPIENPNPTTSVLPFNAASCQSTERDRAKCNYINLNAQQIAPLQRKQRKSIVSAVKL